VYGTDILTPKDEHTTYYFWGVTRSYQLEDPAADAQWHKIIEMAFDGQDKPMIEGQQRMLGERDIEDLDTVMFPADAGAVRARRVLSALIKDQAAPQPQNPPMRPHRLEVQASIAPVMPAM
jgi:vanillate O-demethylase monooxygenase subunit